MIEFSTSDVSFSQVEHLVRIKEIIRRRRSLKSTNNSHFTTWGYFLEAQTGIKVSQNNQVIRSNHLPGPLSQRSGLF